MRNTFLVRFLLTAMTLMGASSANAGTYTWDFTSNSSISASGLLTVDANDDVTALSGNVGGQAITNFFANPNFPGTATLAPVPNTGGANFTYDDFFNPATNAVTIDGILFSTGAGANEIVYDLSVDGGGPSANADLFSITKDGSYVFNDGVISSSVSETPLPASWTMMLAGLAALGFVAYRGKKARAEA